LLQDDTARRYLERHGIWGGSPMPLQMILLVITGEKGV
jgi:hypothetical protein